MTTFRKYEGTGNDFIVVERQLPLSVVQAVCARHTGIGADGVLVVDEISLDQHSARMRIFNADGSRPEMCGNGVRCVARYLVEEHGFESRLTVISDAGRKDCVVAQEPWSVNVNMGPAVFSDDVTFGAFTARCVSMGNPHAVVFHDDLSPYAEWGPVLNDAHHDFPDGVNLEFAIHHNGEFDVAVWERGVGPTQACGTGACAVAAAGWKQFHTSGPTTVNLPGGPLIISQREGSIWMSGSVNYVFSGVYDH